MRHDADKGGAQGRLSFTPEAAPLEIPEFLRQGGNHADRF
jgi:hypothetical protein